MAHPILFGVLGGALAAKFIFRRRFRSRWRGEGCQGRGRWRGRWHDAHQAREGAPPTLELGQVADALELNARQREEAGEVFGELRALGVRGDRLRAVLSTVGAGTFEPIVAEEALDLESAGPRERQLLDGIEHLHNILTPEQREKLKNLVTPG